jgi:hypothetical protein
VDCIGREVSAPPNAEWSGILSLQRVEQKKASMPVVDTEVHPLLTLSLQRNLLGKWKVSPSVPARSAEELSELL